MAGKLSRTRPIRSRIPNNNIIINVLRPVRRSAKNSSAGIKLAFWRARVPVCCSVNPYLYVYVLMYIYIQYMMPSHPHDYLRHTHKHTHALFANHYFDENVLRETFQNVNQLFISTAACLSGRFIDAKVSRGRTNRRTNDNAIQHYYIPTLFFIWLYCGLIIIYYVYCIGTVLVDTLHRWIQIYSNGDTNFCKFISLCFLAIPSQ